MEWSNDVGAADWIVERLLRWFGDRRRLPTLYVGGSPVLIERVLEDERLEAIPVRVEDRGIRD